MQPITILIFIASFSMIPTIVWIDKILFTGMYKCPKCGLDIITNKHFLQASIMEYLMFVMGIAVGVFMVMK